MKRKPIQVKFRTWDIIRLEAIRQTFKKGHAVSMSEVIGKLAEKVNKKHKLI